jgi:type I site-specific restriction endonuclease
MPAHRERLGPCGAIAELQFCLPDAFRARAAEHAAQRMVEAMPPLPIRNLRDCQLSVVTGLERSHAQNKPCALIHMATGAAKTFTAITAAYRLLKFEGVRRILCLVDTRNFGKQAHQEFMAYAPPDDACKFTRLMPMSAVGALQECTREVNEIERRCAQ